MGIFSKDKLDKIEAEEAAEEQAQKTHTILIVDDEEANLVAMASILEENYNLLRAGDGYEALAMIEEMEKPESVCLVISDQRMAGMTGVMLFEKLAVLIPKTIRIIVTGFIDVEAIIDSVNKAQIYKFILKPFERIELLWTITRAVEAFELQQQLDDYLKTLEERVVERTHELDNKNQELQLAYKSLEELSLIDSLTMLNNRRFLVKHLDADVAICLRMYADWLNGDRRKPLDMADLVFFVIDIDSFKGVNDAHGHAGGDQVLMQIRKILLGVFRESDFLVRWGGEEFLVIARFINRKHAPMLAERLRAGFEEQAFKVANKPPVHKTCSIGYACFPFVEEQPRLLSWMQLVDIADMCMYTAKNSQRNAWVGVSTVPGLNTEGLFQRFSEHPGELVERNELTYETSIEGNKPLVWDK
ncbi:MAG: two-component system cell cycle response regulator [Phenylobacterium sp.]|jgi:two-component system cell cycle response regulator